MINLCGGESLEKGIAARGMDSARKIVKKDLENHQSSIDFGYFLLNYYFLYVINT